MSKIFAIILVFALFSLEISGQECGLGTYRIIFSTKDRVNFELFSLTLKGESYHSEKQKDFLAETFFPNEKKESMFWRQALIVKKTLAEEFLNSYKIENYENNYYPSSKTGKSKSQIILETVETNEKPFLLQISSQKYGKSYFLGRFLGGCMLGSKIDLENQTIEDFPR